MRQVSSRENDYILGAMRQVALAGMHPINPMSGHILPVIFFFHFGEQLNDVGHADRGGLDPDEFWHAWARSAENRRHLRSPVDRLGLGQEGSRGSPSNFQCLATGAPSLEGHALYVGET